MEAVAVSVAEASLPLGSPAGLHAHLHTHTHTHGSCPHFADSLVRVKGRNSEFSSGRTGSVCCVGLRRSQAVLVVLFSRAQVLVQKCEHNGDVEVGTTAKLLSVSGVRNYCL